MKNGLIASLFLLCSISSFAQTKKDYERVFHKFVKCYNNNKIKKFKGLEIGELKHDTGKGLFLDAKKDLGKITSWRFVCIDSSHLDVTTQTVQAVFCVRFNKLFEGRNKFASYFYLTKENKITGYSLGSTSPRFDSLISKY